MPSSDYGPFLRGLRLEGYKFRRQHPIGWFIVESSASSIAWRSKPTAASMRTTMMTSAEQRGWKAGDGGSFVFGTTRFLGGPESVQDANLRALEAAGPSV